ncbi:stage III sporulation protein AE [uncultured Ruminococcus sp.]|uniref:stage III sporulation protein AE n=1 Tax=uncultured Ruminococcus sp. TaxID=165186 RepID=UPI00262B19EF|nr:hypothetical protein [uncultured Ruminococcus sp.]
MKKIWISLTIAGLLLLTLGWWCAVPAHAEEDDMTHTFAEESGSADVTDSLDWDVQSVLDRLGLSVSDPTKIAEAFTLSTVWDVLGEYISEYVERPFQMLAGLLTVIIFAALLQGLHSGNMRNGTEQVFEFLCALAAVGILAEPLCQSFTAVENALNQGAEFMLVFVPVFAGILAAGGTAGSAVCYQTAVIALADGVMQVITRVLLPFCTMGFALAIVDAVSPSVSVSGLLTLSKKVTTWVLGLFMSIFLGVLSMQNWITGSVDTAATKTTKYVISNFVPVVGSAVSDAYTAVRSSLQILRSTTGVIGIAAICILFLPPLVQLLLYRGVVAIGTAAAELFGTQRLLRLLRGTQQVLAIAFALLVCFGVMFVVATAIAMTLGKGNA